MTKLSDIAQPLFNSITVITRAFGEKNKIDPKEIEALEVMIYLIFKEVFEVDKGGDHFGMYGYGVEPYE